MKTKISKEIKELIVKANDQGIKSTKIAELYSVKVDSVRSFLHRYRKDQQITRTPGKKPKKLTDEMVTTLRSWFDADCLTTLEDAKEKLADQFGVIVSIQTVKNYLDKLHFSFKRVSLIPERRNTPENIIARKEYARQLTPLLRSKEKIFYLDETGIAVNARVNYGWSEVGKRSNLDVKAIRGKNYSVCAVMNCNSLYLYEVNEKAYNTVHFMEFLEKFVRHLETDEIQGATVIMDNVPFHKSEPVKNLFSSAGHNLMYLPAYSPFLNPIENLFNQLKNLVKRSRPNCPDDVFNGVELASQVISSTDCSNYFDNMITYLVSCAAGEEIAN